MSNRAFITVPFKAEEGFNYIAGVGKFSAAGVVLEFETKIFNVIKKGVKEVRFAADEILDAKLKKGVFKFGAKIEIRLKSLAKLSEVPTKNGKIVLNVARGDFARAAEAVARLQKELDDCNEPERLTASPVSRLFDGSEDDTKELND